MKTIITSVLLVLAFSAPAQQKKLVANTYEAAISNADKFTSKSGTLIKKEFEDIGTIGGKYSCKIQVATYTDMLAGLSIKSVRIKYNYPGDNDAKIASIDADELDGVLKALKMLKENVYTKSQTNYTEVDFISRTGFSIGGYYDASLWHPYIDLSKGGYHTYLPLELGDMDNAFNVFASAKAKL